LLRFLKNFEECDAFLERFWRPVSTDCAKISIRLPVATTEAPKKGRSVSPYGA
jgi:hypothetical protein